MTLAADRVACRAILPVLGDNLQCCNLEVKLAELKDGGCLLQTTRNVVKSGKATAARL